MTYNHEYETLCRDMDTTEQMQENALAFKEWRNAGRAEQLAYERWLIICGVRMETVVESDTLAPVIPIQRVSSETLVREDV